jgi:hypothetical protein
MEPLKGAMQTRPQRVLHRRPKRSLTQSLCHGPSTKVSIAGLLASGSGDDLVVRPSPVHQVATTTITAKALTLMPQVG